MKKLGIFCLLFMIALSACRDNIDEVTTTEDPYQPPIINWNHTALMVNSSVTGFVADEAGEPIANADVKVGNMNTTTDDYGHFFLNDVSLDAKGTVVTVKKPGYFNGSRRFLAVENQENRVKIQMLSKSFDYNFDASNGGTVQTADGASIVFPANSIKKADGTIYTGEVKVAAKWLDPSNVETFDRMPGNLQGVSRDVEEVALGTYGMMAVELESSTGEALNITEGSTATLSMPIPASLQANAPSEIPLWSYSEEHGVWVEEEFTATLTNGSYVGEVSHFSFWNCDYPFPLVEFTLVLVDENGEPLSNYKVAICVDSTATGAGWGTGYGYTCPDGSLAGLIPADQDLIVKVFSICGELLYSQNIGPFSADVNLGTITVTNTPVGQTTISGDLLDCNNNPVQNGIIIAEFDGYTVYEYVTDGTFDISFTTCANSSDVTLVGSDLDALKQSDPITYAANGIYTGEQVSACDAQLQDYISITVDDGSGSVSVVYQPAFAYPDSLIAGGLGTSFTYITPTGAVTVHFTVPGLTAGNYDSNNILVSINDPDNQWQFGQGENFSSFEITQYGNVGEPITGTFGGTLTNYAVQPPVTVTVTGDFNIIR